jgi:hypothetical protein
VSRLGYSACKAQASYYTCFYPWWCLSLSYISTLSHKWKDFRKKEPYWPYSMCFYFLHNFVWNFPHSKKNSAIILNVPRSSCKLPVVLVRFYDTWIFSTDFRRILKNQIFENPSSWGWVVQCGGADRQTCMSKLRVGFRNFVNASIKEKRKRSEHGNKNAVFLICWEVLD